MADVRETARDELAGDLTPEPQHAVGRGMLRADVDQHVVAAGLRREPPRDLTAPAPPAAQRQRDADGAPLCVQPRRRELELDRARSEEHTSELQSLAYLVCRLLLEKKKKNKKSHTIHDQF